MSIDVDDILSDAELDEYLGGQVLGSTTLLPAAWTDGKPARQYALDEILRLLKRAFPTIVEADIVATDTLKRAVKLGAAARLYELAVTNCSDPSAFFQIEKRYRGLLNDEIRFLGDEINETKPALDPKGRGRRSVSIVRR